LTTTILNAEAVAKSVQFAGLALEILPPQTLAVVAARSLAIVGASGSGKSTLLGLLAGLDTPSAGTVNLCGYNLNGLSEDARAQIRAQHVGFVFQQFQLLGSLTALENVMLPLELAGLGNAKARARSMLDQVGLADRAQHMPRTLSGGEQQRVALARAFVVEPKILFADEPTGSLDQSTGQHIESLMFSMQQQFGTSLILVTHDARLAARCDNQLALLAARAVAPANETVASGVALGSPTS
jgi:putative ABC transport system ATP-binding protein